MKKTPLFNTHVKLDAKMTDFFGWQMPLQYSSIIKEHNSVRNSCGLFDLFHMGEFWLNGPDAMKNLQRIVTQDIEAIADRQIAYTPICKPDGTIVDDLLIYRWNPDKYLLVVNASNIEKDYKWIESNLEGDVHFDDQSNNTGLIAIQGPKAEVVLQKLTRQRLKALKFQRFTTGRVADIDSIISRTGYTGEDGFEIYYAAEHSEKLFEALLEAGKEFDIQPIGLGARDTLRLEACLMLYGNDIDEQTTPIEANMSWTVKFEKGDFIGADILKQQKEEGIAKTIVGFTMGKGPAPRNGYKVFKNAKQIGSVTSGTMSPYLKKNIGLAHVAPEHSKIGSEIDIEVRGKNYSAQIVEIPFYKRKRS